MWLKQCHKPPILEWFIHVYTTYKHGDFPGGWLWPLWHCFTHMKKPSHEYCKRPVTKKPWFFNPMFKTIAAVGVHFLRLFCWLYIPISSGYGGFKHDFYFPFHIWDVIFPIDELHHFSRWLKPPTSHG